MIGSRTLPPTPEAPEAPETPEMTPVGLLEARAAMYPDEAALAVGAQVLSFADWRERADETARQFARTGVRQGDVVLLRFSLGRFLDYAVAYIATLAVGAVAVPLADDAVQDTVSRIGAACNAAWSVRAGGGHGDGLVVEPVARRTAAPRAAHRPDSGPARPRATDVAEIIFTSGTTGDPQGVACPYGEIGFSYDLTVPADHSAASRGPQIHAAAFGTNFSQEMLRSPLNWGSFVVTLPEFGAGPVGEAVDRYAVTILRLTPVMAHTLTRHGASVADRLAGVREISVSSAFCPPEILARLQELAPEALVVNHYSLTESGRAKLKSVWGADPGDALGRPVEGSEVRIVGDTGVLPTFDVGEIQLRHVEAVRRWYLQDGAADPGEGWVSTGDLGYLDSDGYVYLLDRAKDLIHVGGRKVSPLAVERVLRGVDGVSDVAVCGLPHATLGEVVAALIVAEAGPDTRPDLDLTGLLQPHEMPRTVLVVAEIPRNPAGKVSRDAVRLAFEQRERPVAPEESKGDALEETFLALCGEVLGQEVAGLESSWYAEGGDSLSAAELVAAIEDRLGVLLELSEELFFGEGCLGDILVELRRGLDGTGSA